MIAITLRFGRHILGTLAVDGIRLYAAQLRTPRGAEYMQEGLAHPGRRPGWAQAHWENRQWTLVRMLRAGHEALDRPTGVDHRDRSVLAVAGDAVWPARQGRAPSPTAALAEPAWLNARRDKHRGPVTMTTAQHERRVVNR